MVQDLLAALRQQQRIDVSRPERLLGLAHFELDETIRQQVELAMVTLHCQGSQLDLRRRLIVSSTDTNGDYIKQ